MPTGFFTVPVGSTFGCGGSDWQAAASDATSATPQTVAARLFTLLAPSSTHLSGDTISRHAQATPALPPCHAYAGAMTSLPRRFVRLPAAVALLLALGACGGTDDGDSETVADDPSAPTSSQSPTEQSPSPTPSGDADDGDDDGDDGTDDDQDDDGDQDGDEGAGGSALGPKLLTAAEMPGLNDQTSWTVEETGPEDDDGFGDCQRFPLADLGAQEVLVREFSDGDLEAEQLLARFVDAKSAWRVHQVLKTWRTKCAAHLDEDVEKIGPLRKVDVPSGVAEHYLVQYGDSDDEEHNFNGVALNRKGKLLSIVHIDVEGQDYNYPTGEEPAAKAARAVAGKIG